MHTREVSAPAWLDDLPLKPGPPWLSMGVRALDLADWLVVDDRFDAELALKHELATDDLDAVFLAREGTEDAGAETLDLVLEWLARHHPGLAAPPDRTRHPLD